MQLKNHNLPTDFVFISKMKLGKQDDSCESC